MRSKYAMNPWGVAWGCFNRTKSEMALVLLDDGESRKFVLGDLELAAHD
jgi:hypothetical protein